MSRITEQNFKWLPEPWEEDGKSIGLNWTSYEPPHRKRTRGGFSPQLAVPRPSVGRIKKVNTAHGMQPFSPACPDRAAVGGVKTRLGGSRSACDAKCHAMCAAPPCETGLGGTFFFVTVPSRVGTRVIIDHGTICCCSCRGSLHAVGICFLQLGDAPLIWAALM